MPRRVDFELPTMKATVLVESAADFGLTPDEILKTVTATLDRLPRHVTAGHMDELAGALARRLLEKERGS
jgi:hypothetical protein